MASNSLIEQIYKVIISLINLTLSSVERVLGVFLKVKFITLDKFGKSAREAVFNIINIYNYY